MTAKALRNPWWVVVGSLFGLMVSNGPIMTYSIGVLIKPMATGLGWSRAQVTSGLAISGFTSAISSPIIGRLMDRFGIKPVALICVVLFSLTVASVGLFSKSYIVFMLLYALMGAISSGIAPLPYAKSISGIFDKQRGTALGIAIAGVGVGVVVLPQFTQFLVSSMSWRAAYVGLGILHAVIALPVILFLLREPSKNMSRPSAETAAQAAKPLMTKFREAMSGSLNFWLISGTFFLSAAALTGLATHLVPLLTDSGMSPGMATTVLSTSGIALIVGRVSSGYLVDRLFAPYVTVLYLALPIVGILLLGAGLAVGPSFAGAFLIGIGIGSELSIAAFLISRYFSLPSFGVLYGLLTGLFFFASHSGPFLFDLSFGATGSYKLALISAGVVLAISCILISRLGPYVFPPLGQTSDGAPHATLAAQPTK